MKRVLRLTVVIILLIAGTFNVTYGGSKQEMKITNEVIYQKLIDIERRVVEIEKRQAVFEERFKQIDKRFEQIDKRFEDMNKRFEDMNKRFEQIINFLWIITGIFTAIMVGTIGFAYWDRRTMIREAKRQVYDEMERELKPDKFRKVLSALRELAEVNEEVRKILKREGLL